MEPTPRNIGTGGGDYAERDILKQQGVFMVGESSLLTAETVVGVLHQHVTVGVPPRTSQGVPVDQFAVIGAPAPSAPHIPREFEQAGLREQVTCPGSTHIIYLHGMPGVGKTTLAAQLITTITSDQFSGGVLWGDLEKVTPAELILRLLIVLDGPKAIGVQQASDSLRELFWQRLSKAATGWLLVVDNISDLRRLHEILPANPNSIGKCRVLAIGNSAPTSLSGAWQVKPIRMKELRHEDADTLFAMALGPDRASHLSDTLHAIAELLDYNMQLLLTSVRLFESGTITPTTYLDKLRKHDSQRSLLTSSFVDVLEPIIAGLSQPQQQLFECLGVLGEGDWSIDLLAAIAMRRPGEILSDLAHLVAMNLVEHRIAADIDNNSQVDQRAAQGIAADSRFRAGGLVRTLAQRRMQARGDYVVRAAETLLARYCLDRAQDLEAALRMRSAVPGEPDSLLQPDSEAFARSFRAGLAADMPHIRQSLHWAVMHQDWHLVRRFSHLPYVDLLRHFSANGFDITMSLEMASVIEPTVWSPGVPAYVRLPALAHPADWSIHPEPSAAISDHPTLMSGGKLVQSSDKRAAHPCELNWNMIACHVLDGIFRTACFIESRWLGVRAPELIWIDTDIDGCQFLACDFTNSTWFNIDARHTRLSGSNLCFSLLRDVRLNGADLRGVNFSGAILENVKLSGADLSGANFSGAILRGTSLRRAELAGAIFTGAELQDVDLRGAQVQQTQLAVLWRHSGCDVDFPALLPSREADSARQSRRRTETELLSDDKPLVGADLRALRIETLKRFGINASGADLRATTLAGSNIRLPGIILGRADLRGVNLRGAYLAHANLVDVDARSADLCETTLDQADLTGAVLRATRLRSAELCEAKLVNASMSGADLYDARMVRANLSGADLRQADLRHARLIGARLISARLNGADLSDADLSDADLSDADLSDADLSTAKVNDEQLLQAAAFGNARLPGGRQPYHVHAEFVAESLNLPESLRFSQWTGSYVHVHLPGKLDLQGARFDGFFVNIEMNEFLLCHARLRGIYHECSLRKADLSSVRLEGIFNKVNFREACLYEASLAGADLVACELEKADVSETQLKQAARLRGTRLPDGTLYDGRFKLLGDIEDALNTGISPDDHEAMRQFCASREKLVYVGGR